MLAYLVTVPVDGLLSWYGIEKIGVVIVTLMIIYILIALILSRSITRISYFLPVILYVLWIGISSLWSINVNTSLWSLIVLAYTIIPLFFSIMFPLRPTCCYMVIFLFSISLCIAIFYGMYRLFYFIVDDFNFRLSVSSSYNPSWIAAYAGLVIILSVILFSWHTNRIGKLLWLFIGIIALIGIILTQGRNALLALLMIFLIFVPRHYFIAFYLRTKIKRHYIYSIFLFVIILLTAIFAIIYIINSLPHSFSLDRLALLITLQGDFTAGRFTIWSDYFTILSSTLFWIYGCGFQTAADLLLLKCGYFVEPENIFITIVTELGILGLLLYFNIFVSLYLKYRKIKGILARGAKATLVYSFFLGFGNNTLIYKYFWISLTMSIVLAFWANNTQSISKNRIK